MTHPPQKVAEMQKCGYATWVSDEPSKEFQAKFDAAHIPVLGVRQVRVWGIQVDDERELPGHERTFIPDEELWELVLEAKDGSHYEVNSKFLVPAPK